VIRAAAVALVALVLVGPAAARPAGGGAVAAPLWSPNGLKIAWAQDDGANYDIWMANPDGSSAHVVARSVPGLYQFAAMPDGTFLFDSNLTLLHVGSTGRPQVVARGVTFSLDRKADLIAYQTAADCATCHSPIEVRSLTNGKTWRIGTADRNIYPALSPNGRSVAFTRYLPSGSGGYERTGGIWIADAKGGNPVQRTKSGVCPQWSPDGTKLAYTDFSGIHVVGSRGTARGTVLLRDNVLPGCTVLWAPNGRKVAALSAYGHLRVVDVGSGKSVPVGPPRSFDFAWAPDGSRLLVTGGASGKACPSLFSVRADGSQLRRLVGC
jgi:Tol biopolymer transport system component